MIDKNIMIKQLHGLVSKASGCTEIGLIGYAVASATNLISLHSKASAYKSISVEVSPFIYKNVFRVGVPNLGQCGINTIVATAAIISEPKRKLEIFNSVTDKQKAEAKKLISAKKVNVKVPKNVNPVYAKVKVVTSNNDVIESLVSHYHDHIVYLKKNNKFIVNNGVKDIRKQNSASLKQLDSVTIKDIIQFVKSCKLSEIIYLKKITQINNDIAEYGLKNVVKGSFTDIYLKSIGNNINLFQKIILYTSAAIDARMYGAPLPVATSSGSGDHGLTCSIPQYILHKDKNTPEIVYLQSLVLSNFIIWLVKKNIGNLSALCGSVIAATTGTLAGLAYQLGMSDAKIDNIINSALCTYAMTICDGAKMSCTHKVCTALESGLRIMDMVDKGYCVKAKDGIIANNALKTIKIFKKISDENRDGLNNSIVESIIQIDKTR